jgi:hypothetical protein
MRTVTENEINARRVTEKGQDRSETVMDPRTVRTVPDQ